MGLFQCMICLLCVVISQAVNRPPKIIQQPTDKNIYYKPGESVKIECRGEGIPRPNYRWQRNGIDYNPSGQDDRVVQLPNQGTIVFNKPEDKDEGIFQCFAFNDYGVSASVNINLREAKLAKFNYQETRTMYAEAGADLTLPCTPPVSFPPADVFWVVKEPDGRWSAINFNKRVSMDLEGKLRFTNVMKSDEQSGKAYACMAINYFMRDNSIGPEYKVIIQGNTEQKRQALELWTSPSDQFFLKGSLLRLKCIFAGNPTPDVYWEKLEGTFPDRASFKSFGQELNIKDIQPEDAGTYECMGLNTESTQRATKAFQIRVNSGPYWINEPKDVEASINEKATFMCVAGGNPQPTYIWYINGIPMNKVTDPRIKEANGNYQKRVSVLNNNFTITNLTLEDYMNIQCNATNNHDYVFADVYLNVLAEKPTIIVPPPPTMKVAEGQSVVISCGVTGKPDPIVTWYRDTSLITGGRFKIMPNGYLHVQNAVMADAGNYRCQATNIYERDVTSSSCTVQIRRKTRIEQFPLDLEVRAGYDAKFVCSGSTDFDEAKNMRVYWEKDDKVVSTTEQRMSQNFQDNSLTISGTIVRDSGVYTCIITNGLDESRSYAILTVKDRPDPPSSVTIHRCRQSSVDLKWIKGIDNNAPVQYFIVQYNTSFNSDQWVSAKTVDYTQNTVNIELEPWANYTFRVLATNKIGASLPSFHTKRVCTTDSHQPKQNPRNLRSIGNRRGYLVIEWIPMTQIEHNGPGFQYQLTVKERGTTQLNTYNIDKWENYTVAIAVPNKVYTPYLVKLQAKNNDGDSEQDPEEKTLYSYEDLPKVRPQDVQIADVGSSSARLSWFWDTLWLEERGMMEDIRGQFIGFKIQYWRANEKMTTFREEEILVSDVLPDEPLPGGGRKKRSLTEAVYQLQHLSPYSALQIQICVMNNYYVGPPSDVISFNTFEGVPGPVSNFDVQIRSSNSFTMTWKAPDLEDQNGILVGYDIGYQFVDGLELGAFHDRDEQINDRTATFAVLSGLLPNRKYRVWIFARTKYGRGEGTYIEGTTTSKAELGAPQFDVPFVGENSINVTWAPTAHFGAHVVHYVEYRKDGAADWQQSTDEVLRSYKEIINLERGTYYEVRVVAFDGVHRAYSESQVVGTVGFAAARAIASNYSWFIGVILAGLACIAILVVIYLVHRCRKDVEEKPHSRHNRQGKVINANAPMGGDNDFERESRGQYNDYYKEDRKRYRNDQGERYEDLKRDSYDDRGNDDGAGARGYKNHDYDPKHGGYDHHDDDKGRDYDRDYDKNRDYDRDYDKDRDYDQDYDRYDDDRDRDYDRDSYRDSYNKDSYNKYDDDRDRDGDPPQYDRAPSYERSYSNEKRRYSDDDGEYGGDTSSLKFDDDGAPVDKPPTTPGGSSTFV